MTSPTELLEQGWIYWDPPGKFTHEMWDYLLSIVGEGNYKLLIVSEHVEDDWIRGQFLLSPQAQKNLQAEAGKKDN